MLELLRAAVLDRDPTLDPTVNVDWDELMDRSSNHGILAWVYDGICKLPGAQQPPRQQRINWALSAQEIWDRYAKQEDVLADMVRECVENGMRMLLLKGIGLSELYPKPESRPSGDIDIYFFGEFEKANQLFCSDSNPKIDKKHAEFQYKGIHIENHYLILDTDTSQRRKASEYVLRTLDDVVPGVSNTFQLPPIANLVYLLMHLLHHLRPNTIVPLRLFIDIYFFTQKYIDGKNVGQLASKLNELDLKKSFEFVIGIGESILDKEITMLHLNGINRIQFSAVQLLQFDKVLYRESSSIRDRSRQLWHAYYSTKEICKYTPLSIVHYWTYTMRMQISMIFKGLFHISDNQFFVQGLRKKLMTK